MLKVFPPILCFLLVACLPKPGKLSKVPPSSGITSTDFQIHLFNPNGKKISVQYLGCGGLYLIKDDKGVLIDPFFSHESGLTLIRSVLKKGNGKKNIAADQDQVNQGWASIEAKTGPLVNQVQTILVTHSHYDHLLDVPAFFYKLQSKPLVYLNQSGLNTCFNVLPKEKVVALEDIMTTPDVSRAPQTLISNSSDKIEFYPILADHNSHFKHIKFFDGSVATPVDYFKEPYAKTRANDWLQGNTFAFLIDIVDNNGNIDLRLFVQSSSCNPPAGIPKNLVRSRKVDVAFLGVASYKESPNYPKDLLAAIDPQHVVWIHWEDFFKKNKLRTVRASDVPAFFSIPSVKRYEGRSSMPWPGVKLEINY